MFKRDGSHQAEYGWLVLQQRQSGVEIGMHGRDFVTCLLHLIVEVMVFTAVGRLLFDEGVDLRLLCRGNLVAKIPHALNEKSLALGERERQAIIERRRIRIAAVPPTIR